MSILLSVIGSFKNLTPSPSSGAVLLEDDTYFIMQEDGLTFILLE